jgi:hypothetical protein
MSRLCGLVLLLCLWPATAHGWELERARAVAEVAWNHPCDGQVPVSFRTAPLFAGSGNARGVALLFPCEIRIRADITEWNLLCPLMLHEMGHLAGAEHSDDLGSVMHDPPLYDERCNDHGRTYLGLGKASSRLRRSGLRAALRGHARFLRDKRVRWRSHQPEDRTENR